MICLLCILLAHSELSVFVLITSCLFTLSVLCCIFVVFSHSEILYDNFLLSLQVMEGLVKESTEKILRENSDDLNLYHKNSEQKVRMKMKYTSFCL